MLSARKVFLTQSKSLSQRSSVAASASFYSTSVPKMMAKNNAEEDLQNVTTQALLHEVSVSQAESANQVVPWFLKNMPGSYFRQTAADLRKQHLKAIQAIRDLKQSDLSLKIETKNEDGVDVTFITSTPAKNLLNSQIRDLKTPNNSNLSRVKVFSSLDNELGLNVFSFQDLTKFVAKQATRADAEAVLSAIKDLKAGKAAPDGTPVKYDANLHSDAALDEYLTRVSSTYVQTSNPYHFLLQNKLFHQVKGTDNVAVEILSTTEPGTTSAAWITIAASNVMPDVLLKLSSSLLSAQKLDINRAHLDTVRDPDTAIPDVPQTGYVTMLRLLVSPDPASHHTNFIAQSEFKDVLKTDLKRLKWLDDSTLKLGLTKYPQLGLGKAEIITALASMLHGPLVKINAQSFSSIQTILHLLDGSPHFIQIAESIADLFLAKFKITPGLKGIADDVFQTYYQEINLRISKLHVESARILLSKMLETVKLTLRTNFFNENRYALSLRIHPSVMVNTANPATTALPFGVLFSHGRHFNGFHCRFRDIARGGLRIVTPPNADQFVNESARQFDEAYGLSFAQQLKNKDIPEGGAKAVILINSPHIAPTAKVFAMRKSVKAFTDSVLDLIVKDSVSNLVDYYKKDELIYLGPDEQVIPWDIDWIVERARQRGYPIPAAFMSSKKGAGINHKEYGVTSEGVVVYLDVALKNVLNIDPKKQPFTIKITGGPDGDVAGNLIKILIREYGNNARIVGIADGFGVAEDPSGLDLTELARLVDLSLPITSFNRSKLSATGIMLDASTEEGMSRRSSLPFRVKADAFVPAGGRPNTINGDNWKQFLDVHGKPSSPLIVEGANIFNTPEARKQLFEQAGVVIVKDSSANKCGVITSSCEVAASMLLSKDEFMAVKKELVEDVIVRLKVLARQEAELLFRAYKNYPGALPHFSERISFAIGKVTDAITDALADVHPSDPLFKELLPLIKENLPKKLADVAWDRVPTHFPVQYQRNAIASTLASQLVYHEGIHLVETQPEDKVAPRAFLYYRQQQQILKLAKELEGVLVNGGNVNSLDLESRKKIVDLIRRGGARTALDIF